MIPESDNETQGSIMSDKIRSKEEVETTKGGTTPGESEECSFDMLMADMTSPDYKKFRESSKVTRTIKGNRDVVDLAKMFDQKK